MTVSSALRYIASSDVKYHIGTTNIAENPFTGTVKWGLFAFNYSDPGQLNGLPSQTYDRDGNPHEIHSICWA